MESFPPYQNFNSGFGVLWKTSEISSQFNLELFGPRKLRGNLKTKAILWSEGGPRPLSAMLL
jgi:hypothetical protein